jgi:hypothetical protein
MDKPLKWIIREVKRRSGDPFLLDLLGLLWVEGEAEGRSGFQYV